MAKRFQPNNPKLGAAAVSSDEGLALHLSDEFQLGGRLQAGLLDYDLIRKLKVSELRVLNVLFALVNPEDLNGGEPFVAISQGELCDLTGLARAAVQRGLKSVASRGIITVLDGGVGKDKAIFKLRLRPRPQKSPRLQNRLDRLRDREASEGSLFDQFDRDVPGKCIRTEAFNDSQRALGGIRTEAFNDSQRALGGIRTEAFGASDRGDTKEDLNSVVVVTTTTVPDPRAQMLRAEFPDESVVAVLLQNSKCTAEQIRVAVTLADRQKSFRKSREAFVRAAIENEYKPPRTAEQRRQEARPEHAQEEQAMRAQRIAAKARIESEVKAYLANAPDDELEALREARVAQLQDNPIAVRALRAAPLRQCASVINAVQAMLEARTNGGTR